MLIILFYLIANFLLSAYAERSRRKTTVIGHTVLFCFTLVILLFCTDIPAFSKFTKALFANTYESFLADVGATGFGGVSLLAPFTVVEFFTVAQLVLTLLLVAVDVVFAIYTKKKQFTTVPDDNCTDACSALPYVDRHKYYTYSVLRC